MKKVKYLPSDGLSLLPEKLRKYRKLNGFSQKNVADRLNLSRSAYTYYELGKTCPDPARLNRIAKIFGVPLEVFFDSEEDAVLADSEQETPPERPLRKARSNPTRVGELSSAERDIIAFLRDKEISPEAALEQMKAIFG